MIFLIGLGVFLVGCFLVGCYKAFEHDEKYKCGSSLMLISLNRKNKQ